MIFIYILLLIIASNSYAMSERLSRLVQDFDGKIGIHAINLKTKQEIAERADEFFPMASTRKIVLASYIFDLIDKNQLALDSIINIEKKMLCRDRVSLKIIFMQIMLFAPMIFIRY